LDGLNLSTSRNHAIWVGDLARQACADSARLYLASIAPEDSEGDFRMTHFLEWREKLFNGFFPALLEAAKSRDNSGWSGVYGTDAGLLEALRLQWTRAAEPAQFSMKGLAGVLLDAIAITRARLAEGRSVSHFVAFIAVAGKALIPDMSAQLITAFGLPEARVNATLLNGSAAEYSI
ncbi:methionine--tRNA ligase, partial [Pseudomonas syringae pv. actinidifoliorum]|nr:methionine--tRNA ligase [Pseudomonas syringae pv. actinidifoliorum]